MNKKGILNLEPVREFMVLLLVLAVTAIAMFVALTSIVNNNAALNTASESGSFTNNVITLNDTVAATPSSVSGLRNVVLSSVVIINGTSGATVASGNYTVSGGTITGVAGQSYNGKAVNVSASFTQDVDADGLLVVNNVTAGTTGFFANIPTVFVILGAVVIILAVSMILFAVNRFNNSGGSGGPSL